MTRRLRALPLAALFTLLATAACRSAEPEPAAPPAPITTPTTESEPMTSSPQEAPRPAQIRSAVLAGAWYPGEPAALAREVDGHVARAEVPALPEIFAVVAPHAGYRYSAAVAGYAYRALASRSFSRVILLGPSHRVPLRGLALPEATHFATPLGRVALDTEALDQLAGHPLFRREGRAHAQEHSLEIHLPFLQRIGPREGEEAAWKLVPLVVGALDADGAREAAAALRPLLDGETVVVASSDFTHYGPNFGYVPFTEDVPARLRELDMGACAPIEALDPAALLAYRERTGATICGLNPIAVLLALAPEDTKVSHLAYDSSGRMLDDWENSVSYLSLAFSSASLGAATASPEGGLTAAEKATLLRLARDTVERWVREGVKVDPDRADYAITERLRAASGAFVTLKKRGRLRGCIGEILPQRPLHLVVRDHAIDAAVHDGRFSPVTADELADIDIEVSVLTPPYEVPSWRDIVIGRDGVLLSKGSRRSVFLPQVAPEQGWGVEETLTALAHKAGLPGEAWREGARFEVFQAIVFHEP